MRRLVMLSLVGALAFPTVAMAQSPDASPPIVGFSTQDVCLTITGPVVLMTPESLTAGIANGTFTIDAITDCAAPDASAEPTAVPEPTAEPTVEPEPTAAPVSFKKLSNRDWAKLAKAPDNYTGNGYQLWACISQFDAATGLDTFRAQASNRRLDYWYTDGVNALFTGDEARLEDFVEGDIVSMNVTSAGSFSYDTQAGGNTTAPAFLIDSIKHRGSGC